MIIQIDCAMQFIIVLSLVKDTLDCLCTLCLNNDFIELKSKISRSHNVKIYTTVNGTMILSNI